MLPLPAMWRLFTELFSVFRGRFGQKYRHGNFPSYHYRYRRFIFSDCILNRPQVSIDDIHSLERLNRAWPVAVTNVMSPSDFYFRLLGSYARDHATNHEEIQRFYRSQGNAALPGGIPREMALYAAYCMDNDGGEAQWHRCFVTEVIPPAAGEPPDTPYRARVCFMDHGDLAEISATQLRILRKSFMKLSRQAANGRLVGFTEELCSSFTDAVSRQMVDNFAGLVFGFGTPGAIRPTSVYIVPPLTDDYDSPLPVHVFVEQKMNNGLSVVVNVNYQLQKLLESLLAPPRGVASPRNSTSPSPIASPAAEASRSPPGTPKAAHLVPYPVSMIPAGGSTLDLHVTHVETPHRFWAQRRECKGQLDQLAADLSMQYDQHHPLAPEVVPRVGEMCAAKRNDGVTWARGIITEIVEIPSQSVLVQVHFVDFGDSFLVNLMHTRALRPQHCRLPAQAIGFRLAEVKPDGLFPESGWAPHVIKWFAMRVLNRDYRAKLARAALDLIHFRLAQASSTPVAQFSHFSVPLVFLSSLKEVGGEGDMDISQELIEMGYATKE